MDNNNNLTDQDGHGTSVAGIASADTNNGEGGVGMCANCSLLVMKSGDATDGTIDTVAASEGIEFAIFHGAKSINCSFGSIASEFWADSYNAWQNGCIVVGGMGNNGNNTQYSPASDTYAIGVGAIDNSGNRCSYSNYGSWIGLSAPVCGSVYSPSNQCVTCYEGSNGTSDAAPKFPLSPPSLSTRAFHPPPSPNASTPLPTP